MLPILGEYITIAGGEKVLNNENVSLMHMCIDTDNFDLFEVPCIQQVIDYRWESFALNLHMIGAVAHILYVVVMLLYVNAVYINDNVENKIVYMVLLLICSCYPFIYECRQLYKEGFVRYFGSSENVGHCVYVIGSTLNVAFQLKSPNPHEFNTKFCMIVILIL